MDSEIIISNPFAGADGLIELDRPVGRERLGRWTQKEAPNGGHLPAHVFMSFEQLFFDRRRVPPGQAAEIVSTAVIAANGAEFSRSKITIENGLAVTIEPPRPLAANGNFISDRVVKAVAAHVVLGTVNTALGPDTLAFLATGRKTADETPAAAFGAAGDELAAAQSSRWRHPVRALRDWLGDHFQNALVAGLSSARARLNSDDYDPH